MSNLQSLSDIFTSKIFRIPSYQRGYAWQESQLKDLWLDLQFLKEGKHHYTGQLTIEKVNKVKDEDDIDWLRKENFETYHIVDGQQRLITLTIFLHEILSFLKKEDASFSVKQDWEKYVVRVHADGIQNAYIIGYDTDDEIQKVLRQKVFGASGGQIVESFYTRNIEFAKEFFAENVRALSTKEGVDAVRALYAKITKRLSFNVFEIDGDYNVNVAFETINGRGKPLSALERLKNRLIYLTSFIQKEEGTLQALRKEIINAFGEVYRQLGRNPKKVLNDDKYLRDHCIIYFPDNKGNFQDALFDKAFSLQKGHEGSLTAGEVHRYIESLKELAQYWYATHYPEDSRNHFTSEETLRLGRLSRDMRYFCPLVVAILAKEKDELKRVRIWTELERFIFLTMHCGGATWTSRHQIAHTIYSGTRPVSDILTELANYDYDNGVSKWFVGTAEKLYKDKENGFYGWGGLNYLLYEYEMHLTDGTGVPKIEWEDLAHGKKDTIEHILPQSLKYQYWQERFGTSSEVSEEQRKWLTHSLGNLLPLNKSFNSSFSDHPFPQKKSGEGQMNGRGYYNGSHSEIEVSKCDDWTKDSILERGRKLLVFLQQRWNIKFTPEQVDALLGISLFDPSHSTSQNRAE